MDVAKIHQWASNTIKLRDLEAFTPEWSELEDRTFGIWVSLSELERIHAAELKQDLINRST